jgi:hypothetical protein
MAMQTLSEFETLSEDTGFGSTRSVVVAEKLSDAALELENSGAVVLVQVSRTKKEVQVEGPDVPPVLFEVVVFPDAADAAGCLALPTSYTVDVGTEIILEAVAPEASGYAFTGWYRGLTLLSSDTIARVAVAAPTGAATSDVITAKFDLVP